MLGIGVAEARESVAEGVVALLFSIIVGVFGFGGWEWMSSGEVYISFRQPSVDAVSHLQQDWM